jgi:selenocysteine lyase/cysteine desulfurase
MAATGLEQVLAWKPGAVARRLRGLTDALADAVADIPGVGVIERRHRAPHVLGLRFDGGLPDQMIERLAARDVHVADRQGVMRVSPHVYNDERDVVRFADVLREEVRK